MYEYVVLFCVGVCLCHFRSVPFRFASVSATRFRLKLLSNITTVNNKRLQELRKKKSLRYRYKKKHYI